MGAGRCITGYREHDKIATRPGRHPLPIAPTAPRHYMEHHYDCTASPATLLPYGTAHYASYFQTIIQQGKYPYASEHTISLYGFASRLFSSNPFAVPVLDMPLLATVLTLVLSLGILAIGLWIGTKETDEHGTLLQFCFWLCVSLVLWPANGYYNLSLLLLPLLASCATWKSIPTASFAPWLIIATALLCIPPGWSKVHPALYQTLHMQWGVFCSPPRSMACYSTPGY